VDPGITAILLDAGGVLVFPTRELLLSPLAAEGVSLDPGLLERAHYRAMLAQDLAAAPPAPGTWWREYLAGFVAECGVAEDRRAALAAEVAEATRDHSWASVGSGAAAGLRALAALGLPMGVVSNSDGTVAAELRRLGICYAPDGHEPAAAVQPGGIRVGVVVDSTVVGVSKPDPAIFRIALDALGVPPSRTVLHVGDSLRYDVAGALAAGLQPFHLDPYGFCPAPHGHPHARTLADLAATLAPQAPRPEDPGPEDPGPEDPGPEDPGPEDPGPNLVGPADRLRAHPPRGIDYGFS
jgi:putative hydrolase of the HAD superfamily